MDHIREDVTTDFRWSDDSYYLLETESSRLAKTNSQPSPANQELLNSRRRIVAVEESMRREIALRLHGSVQNRLIVLVERLNQFALDAPAGELAAGLNNLVREIGEPLQRDLQAITHQLYPNILRLGLIPSLQTLCDFNEHALTMELDFDGELANQERENRSLIQDQVKLSAYRIAEEALTNVVKHANAKKAVLELGFGLRGQFKLTVRDDGQGFDPETTSGGLGMMVMSDYAQLVGGETVVESAVGKGTEVTATLPFNGWTPNL